jgi:hypothetical protein
VRTRARSLYFSMLQPVEPSCKTPLYVAFGSILAGAVACEAPEYVPDDFGAADPIALDVSVQVVASGQEALGFVGGGALTPELIADDSGVYWYDQNGSVFGRRSDQGEVVELLVGAEPFHEGPFESKARVVIGLATGADRLFAGDGYAIDDYEFIIESPPSRLLSIPKQGGPTTVLLESETELLHPLVVDGERLIVLGARGGERASTYQVSLANPALVPLPSNPVPSWLAVSGRHIYWTETRNLWRAAFDGAPERLDPLPSDDFSICPGYFLGHYRHSSTADSSIDIDMLYLQDAQSGKARMFARLGLNITGTVCDAQHVYYYSSHSLGGSEEDGQLVRVDVESGQLARLSSPELSHSGVRVLGDDAENIYVDAGGTILAVQKP